MLVGRVFGFIIIRCSGLFVIGLSLAFLLLFGCFLSLSVSFLFTFICLSHFSSSNPTLSSLTCPYLPPQPSQSLTQDPHFPCIQASTSTQYYQILTIQFKLSTDNFIFSYLPIFHELILHIILLLSISFPHFLSSRYVM